MRKITRTSGLNVHRLVASTAMDMAAELFELYAADNAVYKKLRANGQVSEKDARKFFIQKVTPKLYEDARGLLASMLASPLDRVSQSMKDEIEEALLLDNNLRGNRLVSSDAMHA